jgi:hypothetical protein
MVRRSLLCQFQISSFFSGLVLAKIFLNVSTLADFGVACLVLKHNSSAFVSEDARISLDFFMYVTHTALSTAPEIPLCRRITWIEPSTVADHLVRSYPYSVRAHPTQLDLIPLGWISSHSSGSHPTRLDLIPLGWISSHSAGSHPTRLKLIPLVWISFHSPGYHSTRLDIIPLAWISSHSAGSHPTRLGLIPLGRISSHSSGYHPTLLDLIPLGWISSNSVEAHSTRLDIIPLGWISSQSAGSQDSCLAPKLSYSCHKVQGPANETARTIQYRGR